MGAIGERVFVPALLWITYFRKAFNAGGGVRRDLRPHRAGPALHNGEAVEARAVQVRLYLDGFNMREARAFADDPRDEGLRHPGRRQDVDQHALGVVAHVAAEAQFARDAQDIRPEADTLHRATESNAERFDHAIPLSRITQLAKRPPLSLVSASTAPMASAADAEFREGGRQFVQGISKALYIALAGVVLQIVSLGTDFYVWEGTRQSAWFGVPHTSELIFLSALVTAGLLAMTAAGRSPVSGRKAGLTIAIAGLLAAAQLGYRMVAPPFGGRVPEHAAIIGNSCLYYCLPSQAASVDLLMGIWMALLGSLMVAAGGIAHTFGQAGQHAPGTPWRSQVQPEMNPWLGLAALGGAGQFVFGYTVFTFYRTIAPEGATTWSGWLPTPHTASLVLAITVVVIGLVWSAARRRSPLQPSGLGAVIAVLGFISTVRIAYRILQPPFGSPDVAIGPSAYLALASAALIAVAGLAQAKVYWKKAKPIS